MKRFLITVTVLFIAVTGTIQAATYYVSSLGKDSNSGTSTSAAWATIAKVNKTNFLPGDIVLFEGGKTFSGGIYFGTITAGTIARVKGTADKPIVFGSYGTGRAIISSGLNHGFRGYNTSGFKIQNLIFRGAGRTAATTAGIDFYTDVPNTLLTYIYIANVEVYGYKEAGIMFGSWDALTAGFGNVTVLDSKVYDNGDVGITTYSQGRLVHKNFTLRNNKTYNNAGIPEKTSSHSGSGIMLGDVDGALIEYCESYNNGWLNAATSTGPNGIWAYRSNNIIFQHNESHHNKTGTSKDGGGFDFDGGTTNSIMQYNYSHDNDGAGFLLAQFYGAPVMKGLTIRYNISENDGRKNDYSGIHLWSSGSNGGIQDVHIYNNTIYLTRSANGAAKGIMVRSGGLKNIRIRNNIIQTTGGAEIIRLNTTSDVYFEGNDYWSTDATFKIVWAGQTYNSLTAWRTATGQEKTNGVAAGYSINPGLTDPGKGVTIGDPKLLSNLSGYKLSSTSGLIGKGINLNKLYALNVGTRDFFGNNISLLSSFSIGGLQPGGTSAVAALSTTTEPKENPLYDKNVLTPLSVYPNPVAGNAVIKFSLASEKSFVIEVYDMRGSLVRQYEEGMAVPGKIYEYDLEANKLPLGNYVVRLISKSEQQSVKALILR